MKKPRKELHLARAIEKLRKALQAADDLAVSVNGYVQARDASVAAGEIPQEYLDNVKGLHQWGPDEVQQILNIKSGFRDMLTFLDQLHEVVVLKRTADRLDQRKPKR